MRAVILAAGRGRRLGRNLPKALVPVAGQPLVWHAIAFAARLTPEAVVVVGGHGFALLADAVARALAGWPELAVPVHLVENLVPADGNLASLLRARAHLDAEFVVLNVDHIYRPPIAAVVARPAADVTAFVDTDRTLGADDMKVERDGTGRLRHIAKFLPRHDCGYVGVTRVPAAAAARYLDAADALLAEGGPGTAVEEVLARLAARGDPPACRDVSGHGWVEVDTPDDLARAEEIVRAWDRRGAEGDAAPETGSKGGRPA